MGQVLSGGKEMVEHTLGPNDVYTSQKAFGQSFVIGCSREKDYEEIK